MNLNLKSSKKIFTILASLSAFLTIIIALLSFQLFFQFPATNLSDKQADQNIATAQLASSINTPTAPIIGITPRAVSSTSSTQSSTQSSVQSSSSSTSVSTSFSNSSNSSSSPISSSNSSSNSNTNSNSSLTLIQPPVQSISQANTPATSPNFVAQNSSSNSNSNLSSSSNSTNSTNISVRGQNPTGQTSTPSATNTPGNNPTSSPVNAKNTIRTGGASSFFGSLFVLVGILGPIILAGYISKKSLSNSLFRPKMKIAGWKVK